MPEITTNHAITYTNNIASPPTQTFLRVPHAFLPHFGEDCVKSQKNVCVRWRLIPAILCNRKLETVSIKYSPE